MHAIGNIIVTGLFLEKPTSAILSVDFIRIRLKMVDLIRLDYY